MENLRLIWDITDYDKKGALTLEKFYVAMHLISMIQADLSISASNLWSTRSEQLPFFQVNNIQVPEDPASITTKQIEQDKLNLEELQHQPTNVSFADAQSEEKKGHSFCRERVCETCERKRKQKVSSKNIPQMQKKLRLIKMKTLLRKMLPWTLISTV